jgi:putative transposase
MGIKFKNQYRIQSARLQDWDYGKNGAYFITICSKNREYFFGDISRPSDCRSEWEETLHATSLPIMKLSQIGELAQQYWMEIPNHFSFIELGEFIVMPNHMHGILFIN